jgi:phage terminase small subunit
MPPLKNGRHEKFCLEMLKGNSYAEASRRAGYTPTNSREHAGRLLKFKDVAERMKELQDTAVSTYVMSIVERKEKLSEIARQTENLKAADPVAAITELNRMEGVYSQARNGREEEIPITIIEVIRPYLLQNTETA